MVREKIHFAIEVCDSMWARTLCGRTMPKRVCTRTDSYVTCRSCRRVIHRLYTGRW